MGRNRDEFQLNGLLDRGCSFEGKLMFDGTVQINGDFRGEVFSDGTLIVGADAHINARIQVNTIIIDGSVQGIIEAKRKIELHRGSRLVANIVSPALVMEEGAIFHGQCQMMDEATLAEGALPQAAQEAMIAADGEDSLMM